VRRLFASLDEVGEGAVYRHVGTTNECINSFVVDLLPPPDCEIFPGTAENIGSFPYHFGTQDEIDDVDFISDYSVLDGVSFDPDYPNMWDFLPPATMADILLVADNCFCLGDGIDIIRLVTGRPRFPQVDPIPWFYIPTAVAAAPFAVRENNPDGPPLPETCCPDGETPGIQAQVVNGVLQLERTERPERDYVMRKQDAHEQLQSIAGFPKWCCLPDPQDPAKYVMRYLHFPTWPRLDTHDPDPDGGGGKEPLAIVPVVVDIGCTDEGVLKIYWANLVYHDGVLSEVQWDVEAPRPGPAAGNDYNVAPDDPETLDLNKDYQAQDVLVDGFATPIAGDAQGGTCDLAAALLGEIPCDPACPDDGEICEIGANSTEETGQGATEEIAIDAAYAAAAASQVGNCASGSAPTYLCGVTDIGGGLFEATVKYCCV